MANQRTYRAERELAGIQFQVLRTLRPVERVIEGYFRKLALAKHEATSRSKDINPQRQANEIAKDVNKALRILRASAARGDALSINAFLSAYAAAYGDIITKVVQSQRQELAEYAYRVSMLAVADAVSRLGTFYTGKFGVATLSTVPFALTLYLDQDPEQMLGALVEDDYLLEPLAEAAYDVHKEIGNTLITLIRSKMSTLSIPAIGGGYSKPITSSGGLAAAIGIIDSETTPRRYARGRVAAREAHAVTVGIQEGIGRTGIYGRVLGRSVQSKAPEAMMFKGEIWDRFVAWGAIRGIEGRELHSVVASIRSKGTYGRNWFARIISDIAEVDVPDQLIDRFAEHLEERIKVMDTELSY